MAFQKLTELTKKISNLSDTPNASMTATELKAYFDSSPEEIRVFVNKLIDELTKQTAAGQLGATAPTGLSGTTIQGILVELKTFIDDYASNTNVGIESITTAFNKHISNKEIHITAAERDRWNSGGGSNGEGIDLSFLATKEELNTHNNDTTKHITAAERTKWNNGATVADASTTQKGIVMLSDSLTEAVLNKAATANAVKKVNDKFSSTKIILGSSATAEEYACAMGYSAKATGYYSSAFGYYSQATHYNTSAIGSNTVASGEASTALGYGASVQNKEEGVLGVPASGAGTRAWKVPGSFSVAGTKQFEIPHPRTDKRYTHIIRHGAVESPTTGDTLYRYYVDIKGDTAEVKMVGSEDVRTLPTNRSEDGISVSIPLPDYWVSLNINEQVFVSPDRNFSAGYGFVDREKESLELTFKETRKFNVALYGTRNDDHESIQTWHIKGVEREVGESWLGETYVFEDDEIIYENEYLEEEII